MTEIIKLEHECGLTSYSRQVERLNGEMGWDTYYYKRRHGKPGPKGNRTRIKKLFVGKTLTNDEVNEIYEYILEKYPQCDPDPPIDPPAV